MARSHLKLAKSIIFDQIKNGQLSLIWKLFNHNWEIIQSQFLTGQHFLVFDKRRLKKVKSDPHPPPPPPLKRENDVSRDINRLLILTMW